MRFTQFDLWDILADVVPGALAIILFVTLLPKGYVLAKVETLSVFGLSNLFILIILSYVAGWVIQATSLKIDRRISDESDLWGNEMKEVDDALQNEEWNFHRCYYEKAQLFFDSSEAEQFDEMDYELDKENLRHLTYNYLFDNNIGRSHRFHVLFILSRNLYTIFGLAAVGHMTILGLSRAGLYEPAFGFSESIVFILLSAWCAYTMYGSRKYMERSMVKSIMGDFFASQSAPVDAGE